MKDKDDKNLERLYEEVLEEAREVNDPWAKRIDPSDPTYGDIEAEFYGPGERSDTTRHQHVVERQPLPYDLECVK